MSLIPGQIIRLVEVVDPRTGHWHLAAEVAADEGLVLGALVAPRNGAAGQIGFEPVPEWQNYAGAEAPRVEAQVFDQAAPEPGAAITTADAPVRRG